MVAENLNLGLFSSAIGSIYFPLLLLIILLIFVYLIMREVRVMKTVNKRLELELDRKKLEIISEDVRRKKSGFGLMLLSLDKEKLDELKTAEIDVAGLEKDIYTFEALIDSKMKITPLKSILLKIEQPSQWDFSEVDLPPRNRSSLNVRLMTENGGSRWSERVTLRNRSSAS